MDYDLLKVKMKKNKLTYEEMARLLGITLNGFYVDEANLIRKKLGLSKEEAFVIFFNN